MTNEKENMYILTYDNVDKVTHYALAVGQEGIGGC